MATYRSSSVANQLPGRNNSCECQNHQFLLQLAEHSIWDKILLGVVAYVVASFLCTGLSFDISLSSINFLRNTARDTVE